MPRRVVKRLEALNSENLPKRRGRPTKSVNDKLSSFISAKPKEEDDDELYDNEIINLEPKEPQAPAKVEPKDNVTTRDYSPNGRIPIPQAPAKVEESPKEEKPKKKEQAIAKELTTSCHNNSGAILNKDLVDEFAQSQKDIEKLIQEALKKELLQIKEEEKKDKESRRKQKEEEKKREKAEWLRMLGLREQNMKNSIREQFLAKAKQARISNINY
jgi:hypothetical protein